jgi:hypothetical protein
MKCKKDDGSLATVTWRFFYPSCSKLNRMCSGNGAYVAAITVCNLRLF